MELRSDLAKIAETQPTLTSCQKPKRPATCASLGCGAS